MVKRLPTTTLGAKDVTPAASADDPKCLNCGTKLGKNGRCYRCKPGRPRGRERSVTPATAYNGHAKDRLPSIERLNLAVPAPRAGGVVSSVRGELRAMGEILSLVEKLDDGAVERVLTWVLERVREQNGRVRS